MKYSIDDPRHEAEVQELQDRLASYALALTDEELAQDLEQTAEVYGETRTQHMSETALFGDSWPGALLQLEAMEIRLAVLAAEQRARHPVVEAEEFGEIDF